MNTPLKVAKITAIVLVVVALLTVRSARQHEHEDASRVPAKPVMTKIEVKSFAAPTVETLYWVPIAQPETLEMIDNALPLPTQMELLGTDILMLPTVASPPTHKKGLTSHKHKR